MERKLIVDIEIYSGMFCTFLDIGPTRLEQKHDVKCQHKSKFLTIKSNKRALKAWLKLWKDAEEEEAIVRGSETGSSIPGGCISLR